VTDHAAAIVLHGHHAHNSLYAARTQRMLSFDLHHLAAAVRQVSAAQVNCATSCQGEGEASAFARSPVVTCASAFADLIHSGGTQPQKGFKPPGSFATSTGPSSHLEESLISLLVPPPPGANVPWSRITGKGYRCSTVKLSTPESRRFAH
jgi:hypothetical protein